MRRTIVFIASLFCASAAFAEEAKKNTWEFFDYGEERGWSNTNDAGNIIAIHGCNLDGNNRVATFRLTGYMDQLPGESRKEYFLTAAISEHEDSIFAAPSEYFGMEFMFETLLPKDLKDITLRICARAADGNPPETQCNEFKGPGFGEMVKDLCQ